MTGALNSYEIAAKHLQISTDGDPNNSVWRRHLANTYLQQGNLLFTVGSLDRALEAIQDAIEVTQDLIAEDPDDPSLQADLGDRYRTLSQVLAARGDLESAKEASVKDITLCLEMARKDEKNSANFLSLLEGYTWQGRLLMEEGDLAEAIAALNSAVRFGERLIADDPTNTHWQFRLSASYDTLGEALTAAGRTRTLRGLHPASSHVPIAALDASNAYYQNDLAYSHIQVGKARAALGRRTAARESWAEAARVVAPIADADALPAIQETFAQALLLSDRIDEARPVVRRVLEAGWPLDPTTEALCRKHGIEID